MRVGPNILACVREERARLRVYERRAFRFLSCCVGSGARGKLRIISGALR